MRSKVLPEVNGIKKTVSYSDITVDKVEMGKYQKKGTLTAQVRQEIKTVEVYPSIKVNRSGDDSLFGQDDFGLQDGQTFENTESRVYWLNVPINSTPDSVLAKLASIPGATLVKTLSNTPIVDADQQYAIDNNVNGTSMDTFANAQILRYPDNHPTSARKIILDKAGKVQYRTINFSTTEKADVDLRTTNPEDYYASPEILSELHGVASMPGQTI